MDILTKLKHQICALSGDMFRISLEGETLRDRYIALGASRACVEIMELIEVLENDGIHQDSEC